MIVSPRMPMTTRGGRCKQTVVRDSISTDPMHPRAIIREWEDPTPYGPPGTISVSIVVGDGTPGRPLRILSSFASPPPKADLPSAISAASIAIRKEKKK